MKQSKYTKEFKEQTVKLVTEQGLSVAKAASDMGVGLSTLGKWMTIFKPVKADLMGSLEDQQDEIKRMRREIQLLKMERDLLKKTAIYFVKTSTSDAK